MRLVSKLVVEQGRHRFAGRRQFLMGEMFASVLNKGPDGSVIATVRIRRIERATQPVPSPGERPGRSRQVQGFAAAIQTNHLKADRGKQELDCLEMLDHPLIEGNAPDDFGVIRAGPEDSLYGIFDDPVPRLQIGLRQTGMLDKSLGRVGQLFGQKIGYVTRKFAILFRATAPPDMVTRLFNFTGSVAKRVPTSFHLIDKGSNDDPITIGIGFALDKPDQHRRILLICMIRRTRQAIDS
ncbi:MAG: hypothetical protein D6763_07250 [Alphaproteobacteria bacterium]|nr:MAG: hypothetical protein D6763_07250 [Alphaproteobacteria bacterium]